MDSGIKPEALAGELVHSGCGVPHTEGDEGRMPAPNPGGHSPEAVPVVEPAISQVSLHQVHMLPAGRTGATGGPVGALLRQAAGGRQLLALQGTR